VFGILVLVYCPENTALFKRYVKPFKYPVSARISAIEQGNYSWSSATLKLNNQSTNNNF